MTGNARKLKAWRDGVSAGENCLSIEALQRLAEGSSDPKNAQHIAGCPHCQTELVMLRSFESSIPPEDDAEAVDWIAARLQLAQDMPSSPVHISAWQTLLRIPNLVAAAALTLLIGLGLSLYVSNRQERLVFHAEPSGVQNMRSVDIRLTGPSGDLDLIPDDFRWEALPLAKSYSIQLLEVDGTELWRGQSAENFLIASPPLKEKMRPGKTLLWKVTALDASGKPIASSNAERFRVTAAKRR
jgi:hypothetical protein